MIHIKSARQHRPLRSASVCGFTFHRPAALLTALHNSPHASRRQFYCRGANYIASSPDSAFFFFFPLFLALKGEGMCSCSLCESKDDDCHSDTGGDEMSELWDCFFFSFFFFFCSPLATEIAFITIPNHLHPLVIIVTSFNSHCHYIRHWWYWYIWMCWNWKGSCLGNHGWEGSAHWPGWLKD